MQRYVVFLRAVNVGGAKLPMAALREIAESLGAVDVSTYIASGNLICTLAGSPQEFAAALESQITERFEYAREAIWRTPAQLEAALAAHPFPVDNPAFSYISFCRDAPLPEAIARAERFGTGEDRWQVIGADLHIRYADGAGHAQMPAASVLRALGTPTTARNLTTVGAVLRLATRG